MFSTNSELLTSIQYLKGVGPYTSKLLEKKSIYSVLDAISFFPRSYEDRRVIKKIIDLVPKEKQVFVGKVFYIDELHTRISQKRILVVKISDQTSSITLKWFKPAHNMKKSFKIGQIILVSGQVSEYGGSIEVFHPDIEKICENDFSHEIGKSTLTGIIPIYPASEGLTQKKIRSVINRAILEKLDFAIDFLPENIIKKYNMLSLKDAVRELHVPSKNSDFQRLLSFHSRAHLRLIFNELFILELIMGIRKRGIKKEKGISFKFTGKLNQKLLQALPFKLTDSQNKVFEEIVSDLKSTFPMNRLLQGDVGSGKTLIALLTALNVIEAGYQVALMAPTEILSTQHFKTTKDLFSSLGVKTTLLISGLKSSQKKEALSHISSGEANIVIGTHAIIEEKVKFKNLGLVIIDEQHRFGVKQRQALVKKSMVNVDLLIMTATPIPRTLSLTVYGDLDVSTINELPPGRSPIDTEICYERKRETLYSLIRKRVERKEQVYVVYPLVEESEKLDLKDAVNMAAHLKNDIFPQFKIDLIHGKMKQSEKEDIMSRFRDGQTDILVSTTVIEVGVDVPNATLMIIEHAERFGLSQLHQLRGRVGRGKLKSSCTLMTNFKQSEIAERRLKVMTETGDGFKIAEEDLNIRGPGEFLGTRQSGLPGFKIADILRDQKILVFAKKIAMDLLSDDPDLQKPQNKMLKTLIESEEKKHFFN